MSMLSAGLKKVRKSLHLPPVTLKNVATKYAPVALAAAGTFGLGPAAGIAAKVGSVASKIPGVAKAASVVNTLGKSKLGQAARTLNGGKAITLKNTLDSAGKNVAKFGGGILGGLKENPLEYAGALAAGANGAAAFKRAGDYSDKAVKTAEQSYAERAPLRQLGLAGMQKPTAQAPQDFVNSANPFARKRKVVPNATARLL